MKEIFYTALVAFAYAQTLTIVLAQLKPTNFLEIAAYNLIGATIVFVISVAIAKLSKPKTK